MITSGAGEMAKLVRELAVQVRGSECCSPAPMQKNLDVTAHICNPKSIQESKTGKTLLHYCL